MKVSQHANGLVPYNTFKKNVSISLNALHNMIRLMNFFSLLSHYRTFSTLQCHRNDKLTRSIEPLFPPSLKNGYCSLSDNYPSCNRSLSNLICCSTQQYPLTRDWAWVCPRSSLLTIPLYRHPRVALANFLVCAIKEEASHPPTAIAPPSYHYREKLLSARREAIPVRIAIGFCRSENPLDRNATCTHAENLSRYIHGCLS